MARPGTIKPGEVRNPEGRNQWTYRRDAERNLQERLDREFRKGDASQAIIDRLVKDAIAGKPVALKLALDRILPVTSKVEASVSTEPVMPVQRFSPDTDWERKFEELSARRSERTPERSGRAERIAELVAEVRARKDTPEGDLH